MAFQVVPPHADPVRRPYAYQRAEVQRMAAIATLTFGTAFTAVAAGYSLAPAGPGMRAAPAAAIAADRIALRDEAIAATAVSYLDGVWTASTEGDAEAGTPVDTINATVPGDIISDLFAAGRVGNPLFVPNRGLAQTYRKKALRIPAFLVGILDPASG